MMKFRLVVATLTVATIVLTAATSATADSNGVTVYRDMSATVQSIAGVPYGTQTALRTWIAPMPDNGVDLIDEPGFPVGPLETDEKGTSKRSALSDGRYAYDTDGRGVDVYVMDMTPPSDEIPYLKSLGNVDFAPGAPAHADGYCFKFREDQYVKKPTHAAMVISLILQVAPATHVIFMGYDGCNGWGGADWANWIINNRAANRPALISASIQGPNWFSEVGLLQEAGISLVQASGNDSHAIDELPIAGSADQVMEDGSLGWADSCVHGFNDPRRIQVGAIDNAIMDDGSKDKWVAGWQPAAYSNVGKCIDVFAATATNFYINPDERIARPGAGTSAAAPLVAGVIARHLQTSPTDTPAQVKAWLLATAKDATGVMPDTLPGTTKKVLYMPAVIHKTNPGSLSLFIGKCIANVGLPVKAAKLNAIWSPALFDGFGKLKGYQIALLKNGKNVWSKMQASNKYFGSLPAPNAKYVLQVTQVTDAGRGPTATFEFSTKKLGTCGPQTVNSQGWVEIIKDQHWKK